MELAGEARSLVAQAEVSPDAPDAPEPENRVTRATDRFFARTGRSYGARESASSRVGSVLLFDSVIGGSPVLVFVVRDRHVRTSARAAATMERYRIGVGGGAIAWSATFVTSNASMVAFGGPTVAIGGPTVAIGRLVARIDASIVAVGHRFATNDASFVAVGLPFATVGHPFATIGHRFATSDAFFVTSEASLALPRDPYVVALPPLPLFPRGSGGSYGHRMAGTPLEGLRTPPKPYDHHTDRTNLL